MAPPRPALLQGPWEGRVGRRGVAGARLGRAEEEGPWAGQPGTGADRGTVDSGWAGPGVGSCVCSPVR